MKKTALAAAAFLALVAVASFRPAATRVATPKADMFFGTTPCPDFVKPRLKIPAAENCDRIKWQMTVSESGRYYIGYEWGFYVDNRTYASKGKTGVDGTWKITKGRSGDPNGVVVQLDGGRADSIAFALINQDIIHLLDVDKSLALGNSGASYTLNRLARGLGLPAGSSGLSTDTETTAETNFSGRSPCVEIAKEISHPVAADCAKLKWDLDLYRDPKTLIPTTYRLRGTLYRHGPQQAEHIREGKWKVTKGTKTDPNAMVYELDADGSDGPIFLLKGDGNILFFLARDRSLLVGDADFSYTLNRDPKLVVRSKS